MQSLFDSSKQEVTVTDIKMPFWSIVVFMLKWAAATIPAFIILTGVSIVILIAAKIFLGVIGL
jgi:hypothetical protein